MIHQLIFASPRPGMSEPEFHDYWTRVHAVRYASRIPQIKRYAVDTRTALPGEDGDPQWSGVAEIWLPGPEEQLASLQTREFLDGARMDEPRWAAFWQTIVLDTDTHVLVDGPPFQRDEPGVKLFLLYKRREGWSLDDARRHALVKHAPTAGPIPGLRRYWLGQVVDGAYGVGEAVLDGAHQLWFDDVDALVAARSSAAFRTFLDGLFDYAEPRYVHQLATRQNWIIGPAYRA
ncbi:EthD domain-containing protein [Kutzneria kofuensis]|uniref:EthD domain-containing protein n=1 Tax=Kutzneria kofuensis TaxID=103725 RepID=A0A7W9NLP5_9PSEU|nr:EthD domain-containing protein [Kutzneria kofuensis]MBB5896994.1 hypothetical protein [Kutzneria kofuensis]